MSTETEITDRTAHVHRIAQPAWLQGGVTSPQAFIPRPKDKGDLSLFNKGDTSQDAVDAWCDNFPSSPVKQCLTLPVGSYNDLEIKVFETPTSRFPSHASARFAGKSDDQIEIIAALLAEAATVGP